MWPGFLAGIKHSPNAFTTRENPPFASSVSDCPLGQLRLLSRCGLWPQQVVEPSPASRAH